MKWSKNDKVSLINLVLHGIDTLKLKITLDRHSPRLKLNYCLLPDPPLFLLLPTFNTQYLLQVLLEGNSTAVVYVHLQISHYVPPLYRSKVHIHAGYKIPLCGYLSAWNYRPCFRENQPKRSFSIKWKRAFWACFRENWVYKFGHRCHWPENLCTWFS